MRRTLLFIGLGLVAGAVLHRPADAQVRDTIPRRRPDSTLAIPIPLKADSLLRDTLAKRDSLKRVKPVPRDTIKSPITHAELPPDIAIARRLHWSGDSLAATGAITVADLLERIPGITTLHAGWIASPANAAYLGDVHRVRVFYDGLTMDPLDPRARGALDLTQINLFGVEDAVVEQGAQEVRVYLRSWRVRNTTPYTRTDVSTGDQQTNLYRGFFGKRYDNGLDLQFGAQQFGTTPPTIYGTSSDQLGLIGRVGWAKRDWSVDGHVSRISRHRGSIFGSLVLDVPTDSIPAVDGARTDAYIRAGYRDPDTSLVWGQAMIVASAYSYTGIRTKTIALPKTPADTAFNKVSLDTSRSQRQLILTAGSTRGPLRFSGAERFYTRGGKSQSAPSGRLSFDGGRLAISAFAEGKTVDSASRADVTTSFALLPFVRLLGSAGRLSDSHIGDSSFSANYVRAEAGLRVGGLWLIGGVIQRDSLRLPAPNIFDTTFVARREGTVRGTTAAIRGRVYRLLSADVSAIRWNDSTGVYRPRYQTRSELSAKTNLLEQFPTGNLGLAGSIVHEYRSGTLFPVAKGQFLQTTGYRTISSLVEIRILSATISWQFRNFLGEKYAQVPGFILPRQTNYYGVRWEFFN